jgi:molybdopterin synthase sulfur carrier subunit
VIRVVLPAHLRTLARISGELPVDANRATIDAVLDEIERRFPMLSGTIRDAQTRKRRPFIRFFACQRDLSHDATDETLPEAVAQGREPLLIVGAIAGG